MDFSANATTGCAPFTVNFIDQSTPTPISWDWDFGDGNSSTSKDPSNVYYNPGVYTVTLEVTFPGNTQQTLTKTAYITIHSKPAADFSATNVSGCKALPVTFTNNTVAGSAPITSYTWDFGNTFSDTSKNTSHTYRTAGVFDVKLIVTDANGCTDIKEKKSLVDVWQTPVASFSSSNNKGCTAPHSVSFVNTSVDNATGASTYAWNFGNGNTSSIKTPGNSYANPGSYDVRLIVVNSKGCRDTLIKPAFVEIQDVKADFTFTPSSGCSPLKVNFLNSTTPKLSSNQYNWSFGTGAKGTAQDTIYTYYAQGNYTVKLKVTTALGCVDSIEKSNAVQVQPGPRATFTASDSSSCTAPLAVKFTATGPGVSWFWQFGDGTTSNQKNPTKTYLDTGKYKVKLTVSSANGCIDSNVVDDLIRIGAPKADFIPSVLEGCAPLKVGFSNVTQTYAPLAQITYKFGDGTTSNQGFPNKTYTDTGFFIPKLIILTDDGCIDSATYDTIFVGMKPAANFTVSNTVGCIGLLNTTFKSLTNMGNVKADKFLWYPGNGQRVEGEEVEYVYSSSSRLYDVMLIASHKGCPDTLVKKNLVEVLSPTSKFFAISAGCNDDSIHFQNNSLGGTKFWWDFDDGDTLYSDTLGDADHVYLPGLYEPTLIVYDSTTGCYDTNSNYVEVVSSDVLKFRSDTVGCTRQTLWFFDQTPNSSDWIWRVGEAEICTTRNCQIVFTEPGWKDVFFSAIVSGCRYTTIKKAYVHVYGPGFEYLTGSDPICVPEQKDIVTRVFSERPIQSRTVSVFENFTLIDQKTNFGDTLSYYFDRPPPNQNTELRFQYYVIDSGGCSNYGRDTFRILRPSVDFVNQREATCEGDLQLFTATLLDTTSPEPMRYVWDFGDGQSETIDTLSLYHTYTQDGIYSVNLIAFDGEGCSDTVPMTLPIDVKNIKADFVASDTFKSCPPMVVDFTDKSEDTYNGIVRWDWRLGEGTAGNATNPKKIYNEPGVFDIFLKVTDSLGCTDSIFKPAHIVLEGAKVNFSLDLDYGCEPLTIHVAAQAPPNVDVRWNMRDGTPIYDTSEVIHTYQKAGLYAPSVFIKDVKGCQYVVVADDTVEVIPSPIADFEVDPVCVGETSDLVNQSVDHGEVVDYTWIFGPQDSLNTVNASWQFPGSGYYPVTLKALSDKGCYSDTTIEAYVSDPKGKLLLADKRSCAYDTTFFELLNLSQGRVISVTWYPKDGSSFTGTDSGTAYVYKAKGYFKPEALFTNEYGCKVLVKALDSVLVGDNFPPPVPVHYRSTVNDNQQTSTWINANRSIDFEKYLFYRWNPINSRFDSIGQHLNPLDTVFIDAVPTLENTYTYRIISKNLCGYYSDTLVGPQTTMELKASPYDDASYLVWTPYGGWPVSKYRVERFDPIQGDFVSLKEVDGNTTTTYDSSISCRTGYYYRIQAVGPNPENFSLSDTSGAIPRYIPYVPANELFSASVEGQIKNLVSWNFVTPRKAPVRYYILERSADGTNYKECGRYDAFTNYGFDGVDSASTMSLYYRTVVQDTCGYRSEPSNYGKTVMLRTGTDTLDRPVLNWSAYEYWAEDVDYYDIEIFQNGQFEYLASTDGTTLQWTDYITELNNRPQYCYRITARSVEDGGKTAHSNIACAPVHSRIYVPNAFRPGGIEDNSTFHPKGMYIAEFTMRIYDRWGTLIYTTHSMDEGWDGTINGKPAPVGVYVYKIDYRGVDKDFERLSGNLTLLR